MIRASLLTAASLIAGCAPRTGPDLGPIADGMQMIAIAMVLCALVGALAGLIGGNNEEDDS